jgi:hypothetical protein
MRRSRVGGSGIGQESAMPTQPIGVIGAISGSVNGQAKN